MFFLPAKFVSVVRKKTDKWEIFQDTKFKGETWFQQSAHSPKKPTARTAHEEFVRNLPTFPVTGGRFFGGCCLSGRFRYLEVETNMQPRKPNLRVKRSLESISET